MSYRSLPTIRTRAETLLKSLSDRVTKLERGGAFQGIISFGPQIQIGDVSITVTDGVGHERIVTFKNVLTGSTSTIDLP